MNNQFKISIPKPCHENWDKMSPDKTGRFCQSCAKSVVDFTGMKATDIQDYFIAHQNDRVCGRFKNEQLDSIIITIPQHILYSQTQFRKMFLLALFASMGTVLFSCSDANGSKRPIDRIEVSNGHEHVTTGMMLPPKHQDSVTQQPQTAKPVRKTDKTVATGNLLPQIISGDVAVEPIDTTSFIMGMYRAQPHPKPISKDSIDGNRK